jgi:hypothetical protein
MLFRRRVTGPGGGAGGAGDCGPVEEAAGLSGALGERGPPGDGGPSGCDEAVADPGLSSGARYSAASLDIAGEAPPFS